jgi:peptide chain release factor 3
MTAFVFKIQANMDPNHRDRIAFARLCSGKLTRGMKVKQVRTGKSIALTAPQFFFAKDRSVADEAYAGDVVGIPNHGAVRIGDTLTEGEDLNFVGVPSFAPEILRRVRLPDAMKAKKLKEALQQLAEEGVVQVFRPTDGSPALVGVVGPLQLDVLRVRLKDEYGLGCFGTLPNSAWRAGFRPTIPRRWRSSSRITGFRSPTISTAIRSISPRTSSISATPRSARPASSSPT